MNNTATLTGFKWKCEWVLCNPQKSGQPGILTSEWISMLME
jgi:hypothetical protein